MTNAAGPLLCPKCHAVIALDHTYSWCKVCGEPLPQEVLEQLPNVPKGTVASQDSSGESDR